MSRYSNFKKQHAVSAMSREELFEAGYRLGQAGDPAKIEAANRALRDIAEVLMAAFRCGSLRTDQVGKMLSQIKAYDYRLITCNYCYRYVK